MGVQIMTEQVAICVECDDVPAVVLCKECSDHFCGLCFQWLHKKGKRSNHQVVSLDGKDLISPAAVDVKGTTSHFVKMLETQAPVSDEMDASVAGMDNLRKSSDFLKATRNLTSEQLIDRVKYTPLRLTEEERVLLKLMEGVLEVSEYTDKVDVSHNDYGWGFGFWSFSSYSSVRTNSDSKTDVIRRELNEVFSLLSGMYTSLNLQRGQKLITDRDFKDNEEFFQRAFEIARRFKIMNPEKMRTTYGKLMHLLQDAVRPGLLDFNVVIPIKTVHQLLTTCGCASMLTDFTDEVIWASVEIDTNSSEYSSGDLQQQIERKKQAKTILYDEFVSRTKQLTEEQLNLCLNSINDSNGYIASSCYPVEMMIHFLQQYFNPEEETQETSLAIRAGFGGSCLSHSHSTQYQFVLQSLLLWREIQQQMFKLWYLTDEDLLDEENRYRLTNTGQGLNRLQAAPNISGAMASILRKVQSQLRGWVGLSVVHLGDRDVPNALVFIDKYTQVPRILGPITRTLQLINDLYFSDEKLKHLIEHEYGGLELSRREILRDFFRHGFDGSGDDGGSCVDGRLTSSWNWCSRLDKKEFSNLFKLGGFEGFDGSFKR